MTDSKESFRISARATRNFARSHPAHYRVMQKVTATEALQLGIVNEVHPCDQLMIRANALAERLLSFNPFTRRYTCLMFARKLRLRVIAEFPLGIELKGLSMISAVKPKAL